MILKHIFLSILLYSSILASAQYIERPTYFSSAGSYGINTNNQLQSNIGELMSDNYTAISGIVTQGFIQPAPMIISNVKKQSVINITYYPNPFTDEILINFSSSTDIHPEIEVSDMMGKAQHVDIISYPLDGTICYKVIFKTCLSGVYFIKVAANENNIHSTFKVVKL